MARALTLGNGHLLVGLDEHALVHDVYFPHVGLQNHVNVSSSDGISFHHVGVWVDGQLAWLNDPGFSIQMELLPNALIGKTVARHDSLGITLTFFDWVAPNDTIFFRQVTVKNHREQKRDVKVFFSQQFRISEDRTGSTGFYDPNTKSIVHYKGSVAFLIGGANQNQPFDDYGVGLFNMEAKAGSFIDASDGTLSKNAVEHGSVDSVIGFTNHVPGGKENTLLYWMIAGDSIYRVRKLQRAIQFQSADALLAAAKKHWHVWQKQGKPAPTFLPDNLKQLYQISLLVLKAHQDADGGLIASSDSDMLNYGRDTYSYVWPRDGAYIAGALAKAGYLDEAEDWHRFILSCRGEEGYLMHKYRPDGSLGSSWHSWLFNGKPILPIQEDETATELFYVCQHYQQTKDKTFLADTYESSIKPMATFLLEFINPETALPRESYDLWEEVYGTFTYTTASVYGALLATAAVAHEQQDKKFERECRATASLMKEGLLKHLYNHETGAFLKYCRHSEGLERNDIIDVSALHGLWLYGVLAPDDWRLVAMYEAIVEQLRVGGAIDGFVRYQHDNYYRSGPDTSPNPWIVTTMFVTRYLIARAKKTSDLKEAYDWLLWVGKRISETGMLSEQYHPETGQQLSVSPLIWSHAEFITAVHEYEEASRRLK